MEFTKRSLLFLLTLVSSSSSYMMWSVHCYDFSVGGKDGWVFNPSQSFNQWAAKNKFQIHDNLVFKYKKGEDSVLEVSKEDYLTCNATNPIMTMGSGDSWFTFERIGSVFFITGNQCHCDNGQKMVVVVHDGSPRSPGISPFPPSPPPPPTGEDSPTGSSPGPSPFTTSGASNKVVSSMAVVMGAVIGCMLVRLIG